jgi:hypothetical protein
MASPGPLGIYKLLPRTNCRDCGRKSCMAFAHDLMKGEAAPGDCPRLLPEGRDEIASILARISPSEGFHETIAALREEVAALDLALIAPGLGAEHREGKLHVPCLGRDFVVRADGHLESACHVNVWVELMLLNYCATGGRGVLSGRWVSYGELPNAAPTAPYFEKRCEEPLRGIADCHTEVFLDLMEIFGGRPAEGFEADHAFILHPLPRVPFLLLYTRPEGEMPSHLRILLDASVTSFIPKEALTGIGRGIVEMFKKIVSHHRDCTPDLLFM